MNCCCQKVLFLCGDVDTCSGLIKTGVNATVTGIHKFITDFLGTTFIIEANITSGSEIAFPASGLNEKYTFTGKVQKPDGSTLTITKDGIDYDCLSFETNSAYVV